MDNILLEPTLDSVKAVLILDNDGNRILAKYYDDQTWEGNAAQKKFEKSLFTKTHKVGPILETLIKTYKWFLFAGQC